jgi:hypothetical protein
MDQFDSCHAGLPSSARQQRAPPGGGDPASSGAIEPGPEGDPSALALDAQLLHPAFAIVTPTIPGPSADARGVMSEAGHAETDTQANVQVPNDYLLRFHVAYFVAWRAEIEVTTRGS